MDNKLSELSKPRAFVVTGGTLYQDRAFTDKSTAERSKADRNDRAVVEPLYSQEYVSALLAELEVKDKRIAELEGQLQSGFTPVRLPDVLFIKVSGSAVPVMHAQRVKERVRAAGFTVEGDE